MQTKQFKDVAANEFNPNWSKLTERPNTLYSRPDDLRSEFGRDHTRILHSMAYRRLKHKTQVFFNIDNDHICTRMEHVSHVESVSYTIAKTLGLNTELTKAIATGHDLGHAPFGHEGETIIKKLTEDHLGKTFWHEKNGLRFVDKIELLEDDKRVLKNLNLTYAVRDGIISHCGEVDENGLFPRDISIGIEAFDAPGKYQAITWEGCVVKLADKIAYLGRDIEDALTLDFLDGPTQAELLAIAHANDMQVINTTALMHNMIVDICKNSSPEKGICMSSQLSNQLNAIKDFNYKKIYKHKRLEPFKHYSARVINEIFDALFAFYNGKDTWETLEENRHFTPQLIDSFEKWLVRYCSKSIIPNNTELQAIAQECDNEKIYNELETKEIYTQAVIDFIAGMTDRFAITLYNELLEY